MEKTITTTELTGILQAGDPVTLLDVRRKDDFDKAPQTFASAQWKNPAEIDNGCQPFPRTRKWSFTVFVADRSASQFSNGWLKTASKPAMW